MAARRRIWLPFVTFAIVFVSGLAPLLLAKNGLQIAPIWPANGLALVLAIRARHGDLPRLPFCLAFVSATFLANLAGGNALALSAVFTLGNFAEIVSAYAVIHWHGWRSPAYAERSAGHAVLTRIVAAAVIGPAVGATVGAAGLTPVLNQGFLSLWLGWCFSSMVSLLIVASIGFACPRRFEPGKINKRALAEYLAAVLVAAVVVMPAFVSSRIALLVLTAPVIMLAAARFRAVGAGMTLAAVAVVSLTLAGNDQIASRFVALFSTGELVMLIQVYLVVQGVIALMLAAYLDERDALKARVRAQAELAEKQADLRLQLLMNIAHEIRTPLNVVQGCSDLMARSGPLTFDQKDLLGAAQRAATQLQDLALNLLETSRIESGLMSFEPESIEPSPVIKEVAELAKLSTGKPAAQVSIDTAEGTILWADRLRLRQICNNLLTNAIRHGADYGEIVVRLYPGKDDCVLSVEDRGPGFRGDFTVGSIASSGFATANSAGVGLSLVKQMIAAHGGALSVSSTPFVSTRVMVTLPAEGSAAALKAVQLSQRMATAA